MSDSLPVAELLERLARLESSLAERDARIEVLTRRVAEGVAAQGFADLVEASVVGRAGQAPAAVAAAVLGSSAGQAAW